jgi:integrase
MADEFKDVAGREIFTREIDAAFIRKYSLLCKERGNVKNTVMRKLKNLRTIFDQAIHEGVASGPNPFREFKISFDPVKKDKLSIEEIGRIEALELEPERFTFHARNAFLFSYYAQGMRFENVCTVRREHISGDFIKYQMNKGKKFREIIIHDKLRKIITWYLDNWKGPYLFPFFKTDITGANDLRNKKGSVNTLVNFHLKMIASLTNIDIPIQFHMARHTFANRAKKAGVNASIIKDALGHTDSKTTEIYLHRLDDDIINEAVKAVYE